MHSITRLLVTVPIIAVSLLLSACAPNVNTPVSASSSNPQAAKLLWFNTQVGAVKCLTFELPTGYKGDLGMAHDCDWASLKTNQSVTGAQNLSRGTWLKVGSREVFCLQEIAPGNSYGANHPHYNCDWVHPKEVTSSSS